MTRYAIVEPSGEHTLMEADEQALIQSAITEYTQLNTVEATVFYDPRMNGAYNWQATRLGRDRLMPDDRLFGNAFVFGPVDERGAPTDITDDVLRALGERLAARR